MSDKGFQDPEYLGDAVYIGHDGYHVKLRLNAHDNPVGQIALEPSLLDKIPAYYKRMQEKYSGS